jgi:hypothetical protein
MGACRELQAKAKADVILFKTSDILKTISVLKKLGCVTHHLIYPAEFKPIAHRAQPLGLDQ